jgi:hypothetical protein
MFPTTCIASRYRKDLKNVKLGGVASSVGLREADMLDNKVYSESVRVEKYKEKISDVLHLYARMSDGFQFLLSKVGYGLYSCGMKSTHKLETAWFQPLSLLK